MPVPIRESELLDFTKQEWRLLDDDGMETYDLPPDHMAEVFAVKSQIARLSANDCICLVATQCQDDGILLTGDNLLRRVATEKEVRVHGVLWIIDELKAAGICGDDLLIGALEIWRDDKAVFLPPEELNKRLRRLHRE